MFESEVNAYCEMQASPRTRTEYRKDLERWYRAGLPLTVEGVTAYKRHLETNYKEASAGRFWSTVRAFHRWLVQRGLLEHSPFEVVKAPVRRHSVGVESPAANIVDALVASCESKRDRAVICLLLNGLRASEVTDLDKGSMTFETGVGFVLKVLGKGNKERFVPLTDESVEAIMALSDNDRSDWLVPNHDGSKLTYDTVNGIVDTVAKRAGVKVHPHQLRHHYATRLVRAGVNVFALQKLLGHATVATTQRYVSMDLTDLAEAARLDPRNNGGIRLVTEDLEDGTGPRAVSGNRPALRVASA